MTNDDDFNTDLSIICQEGNLSLLKRIHENTNHLHGFEDFYLYGACYSGHLHIIKFLLFDITHLMWYKKRDEDCWCQDHRLRLTRPGAADCEGGFLKAYKEGYFHITEFANEYVLDFKKDSFKVCSGCSIMYYSESQLEKHSRYLLAVFQDYKKFDEYVVKKRYILKLLNLCVNDFYNLF